MKKRGRRSRAEIIVNELKDDNEEGCFLVFYDLPGKISNTFWINLNKLRGHYEDGESIQASVIKCRRRVTAMAIKELANYYDANVMVFKGEEVE